MRKSVNISEFFGRTASPSVTAGKGDARDVQKMKKLTFSDMRDVLLKQNDDIMILPLVRDVLDEVSVCDRKASWDGVPKDSQMSKSEKEKLKRVDKGRKVAMLLAFEMKVHLMEMGSALQERNSDGALERIFMCLSRNHKDLNITTLGNEDVVEFRRRGPSMISRTIPLKHIKEISKGTLTKSTSRKTVQATSGSKTIADGYSFSILIRKRNEEGVLEVDIIHLEAVSPDLFSLWYDGLRSLVYGSSDIMETVQSVNEVCLNFAVYYELHNIKEQVENYRPEVPALPNDFKFSVEVTSSSPDEAESSFPSPLHRGRSNAVV